VLFCGSSSQHLVDFGQPRPSYEHESQDQRRRETHEKIGGYYTIEAANYEEAIKLSRDHPHLEYGGIIELRQAWES
jgi:hypothetical protein